MEVRDGRRQHAVDAAVARVNELATQIMAPYQCIYAILTDLTNDSSACLPWNWLFVQQGPKCVLPPHSGLKSIEA